MVILQLEEQPPLIQAIFSGEIEAIRKLLESKQDVNYQDFEKRSALHAAAFRGDSVITKLLIEHGARVNAKDCKWVTPLHRACYSGSEETVTVLLNNAADLCARDKLWQTPLHIAAASNSLECVSSLLDKIQNPNLTDRSGRTALYHAVLNGHNDIVELLISKGCTVNACNKKDRPIHWAAYKGHIETMEILLQNGADINAQDRNLYTPLHVAAASGAISVIDILMENGAYINAENAYGNTPLHIACLNGHGNFASELIRYKANKEATNDKGQTPLHLAAASIHGVHCLNVLVTHGVDLNKPNIDGRTPLHMTAIHGRFTRSKTLIDKGAVVDSLDKNSCTALHIAAQYGHELLSNTLLSYGADPSRKGFQDRNPLHMCCLSGYIECCRIFIKAGIDLNDKDDTGKTPLHCAAYKGAVECVDLLVSSGADFKIVDNVGRTALHYAAVQGFFFCVFTLVGIGSPVNQADDEGCTALHLASAYDVDGRCVNYLIEHKADPKLKDAKGFTPIHYAVAGNNVNALKYLLYAVGNCNIYGTDMPLTTALHVAAKNGNMEILEKLMPYFPDPNIRNENGCTPLLLAACQGYANCVQMLLRYGAKVSICDNINGLSPVHHSAKNGHVHCLALLVDNAEDKSIIDLPDGLQRTALMLAVSKSHMDCATTLIKSGADPNIVDGDGHSCLFRAVVTGQHNILQMLLNRSTVVNQRDTHGKTVLHLAAACGRNTCLQRILPYMDAEVKESTDNQNFTALHWACYSGNADCVAHFFNEDIFKKMEGNAFSPVHCATSVGSEKCLELLCAQYGPDIVKLKDDRRRRPLHIAAMQGHSDCAKFLLDQGADINYQDDDGKTPLISAASNGQVQAMEALINNKADVTLYDKNGNTALHMACLRKHNQAALLLLKYINDPDIINMVNNDRKTPLHLSARNGLVDITRQLIVKGSSVTAVDANGLTPALCCAPNPSVAQCLAIILASHSLQASDEKESLVGPNYLENIAKTPTSKTAAERTMQTDITLVKDPDQYDLEQMFGVKFQAKTSSSEDLTNTAASRFFIHYKSRDTSETNEMEQDTSVSLKFDDTYTSTSIFDLHSSQSDTVLAPKPIYSEEDYEKLIKQSNEERVTCANVSRPLSKTMRRKLKNKDDMRLTLAPKQIKHDNFKSKSTSVLTTFRSYNSSDFVSVGSDMGQNKDAVQSKKPEKILETLERVYTGAIPKTTRFPKSTNKRLKSQKLEDEFKDHMDRCHICKQFLEASDHDDQNIPLETMQAAIEKALTKKGCSTNRCLLAFLDESYELNAKNAHLIYHGMLSPRCEPYIAKHLNLSESGIEIVESPGEDVKYTIRKVKSTNLEGQKPKSTKIPHGVKTKDHSIKGGTPKTRPDKQPRLIFNKQNRDSKSDLKPKTVKDDENSAKAIVTQRRIRDSKKLISYGHKSFKHLSLKSEMDLDMNKKTNEVQKVQSDSQKVYVSKMKKSKNISITDVTNQQDGDGNCHKIDICGEKIIANKQEEITTKDMEGEPFPEYLKPLTKFNLDPLGGCEDGGRVRCYSTYWCFPEINENNQEENKKNDQKNDEKQRQTKVQSKSDSFFVGKHLQTGDFCSTSHDNAYTSGIRSEAGLKTSIRKKNSSEEIPITFLRTSRNCSNPEMDGMIYFNDKLIEESACTVQDNQEIVVGEFVDDEEIQELEQLRQLDKDVSREDSSVVGQDMYCNLERRVGVLDIKKDSTENVEDWCEDMQQFFTQSRRKQLAEEAEKLSERINVGEWKSLAAKNLSKFDGSITFSETGSVKKAGEYSKAEKSIGDEISNTESSEVFSKIVPDEMEIPVKIESSTGMEISKSKSGNRKSKISNNQAHILIEDGEILRSPSIQKEGGQDCIEVHYDRKFLSSKSSEYCIENEKLENLNMGMQSSSKSIMSKTAECSKTIQEDVSMFNDIPTVTTEEHLIKNTILNEHSEAFLEGVQNRSKETFTTNTLNPKFGTNKRIFIRKTDDENEDKFIMKKPARVTEIIKKRREEKPINWKLYMAHRCLQLSDNMNEQSSQRSWCRKRLSQCFMRVSSSTNVKDKKKPKQSELKGDFRKKRSAECDENLKDSSRYTGLKIEEHDASTLKIDDIIPKENVEKQKKVNFSERVYVVKDKETVYSLSEDEPDVKRGIDTKVGLEDWQTYIDEGTMRPEESKDIVKATSSSDSKIVLKNTDFVDLPKKSPKSFLETIDIKDFVGPEVDTKSNSKESLSYQKEETKSQDEGMHSVQEFEKPNPFIKEYIDIDYELDKLEEELEREIATDQFADNEKHEEVDEENIEQLNAEFEESILKLEEEKTDEEYCEKDVYDLSEMYRFEESDRGQFLEKFAISQEDSCKEKEIIEENIEAVILKESILSFNEVEGEPKVEEIPRKISVELQNSEITYEEHVSFRKEYVDEVKSEEDLLDDSKIANKIFEENSILHEEVGGNDDSKKEENTILCKELILDDKIVENNVPSDDYRLSGEEVIEEMVEDREEKEEIVYDVYSSRSKIEPVSNKEYENEEISEEIFTDKEVNMEVPTFKDQVEDIEISAMQFLASTEYKMIDENKSNDKIKSKECNGIIENEIAIEKLSLNEESAENTVREGSYCENDFQRAEEKYLYLDSSSDDTAILERNHDHEDEDTYLKESQGYASSKDSDEDFDLLDTGFSHVKVDEIMKLKYHSSGDNCDNPMALRYIEESSSAESLDDNAEDIPLDSSRSNHGDGQSEQTCLEAVTKEEDFENSQSEENTTSLERSDEYHDADLLEIEDVDTILPEDIEDTNDNIYYDTESENSGSNNEIVAAVMSESAVLEDENNSQKTSETDGERLLITNDIQMHLEQIIAEQCPESTFHGSKKNSSQKSVHFKFVMEENLATGVTGNPGEDNNFETSPVKSENDNSESLASLNTIYHVGREKLPGAFLESISDMNCLGQIICDGKAQRALFDKQLKEKISLIEGVAPSEDQINENKTKHEDRQNTFPNHFEELAETKDSLNIVVNEVDEDKVEELKEVAKSPPENVLEIAKSTPETVLEIVKSTSENVLEIAKSTPENVLEIAKRTPENVLEINVEHAPDSMESSNINFSSNIECTIEESKAEGSEEENFEESKCVLSNVTVMQLRQNINFFVENTNNDLSSNILHENNEEEVSSNEKYESDVSEVQSLTSRNENMSLPLSTFSGSITEDVAINKNYIDDRDSVISSMKKIDEHCEEIKIEKEEYDEICRGVGLTQNYIEDKDALQSGNICEELIMENQLNLCSDAPKMPPCSSKDFKKTVKISRNVKVEDTDEYHLLDERKSGELKKNKKSFPSISKLGKKAKKDSNCKIS